MNRHEDFNKLCIHTATTKPWTLEEAVSMYSSSGVKGITVWRDALEGKDPGDAGAMIRDAGLSVVSLCRGGFFPAANSSERRKAIDENKRVIDEAHLLGAPLVVLVCGAYPGQSLPESRKQVAEGIQAVIDHAASNKIRIGIEPLHPMYADTRSAVNTVKQANDMVQHLGSEWVGVVIDVYHVWWDDALEEEIQRCGLMNKLFAFHISDWKTPTNDLLNDRGIMGEGCIPIRLIRSWMEASGFQSFHEVEIFSIIRWNQNQDRYLQEILDAYVKYT